MARFLDVARFTPTLGGTTDWTVSAAVTGYQTPAAAGAVDGQTYRYRAESADLSQWEIGYGAASSTGTVFARTTVLFNSSGTTSKISFSTVPTVGIVPLGEDFREKLDANRTYYARTDGSDSNNGLANTSGGAFLTIQKAIDTVATLDITGFIVTIQVADGTYGAGAVLKNVVGFAAPGNLVIQGNNTTPANVLISTTSANTHGFVADSLSSVWDIKDLKIQTSTATSNALVAQGGAALRYGNIDFGVCNGIHIQAFGPGSTVTCLSNYAVSGSAASHYQSYYGAQIISPSKTITITGTLAFTYWADMRVLGSGQLFSQTFSGTYTVTGTRYRSSENAVVFVNGAGATYFPGNANGTPATGGLYT